MNTILIREADIITRQFSDSSLSTRLPISQEEKAFLTYHAMSNSDDIVLLLECDGSVEMSDATIIGANDAFRRASGYSRDHLIGHRAADLLPETNDVERLASAIRGSGSLRSELTCRRADGGTFMLGMHLMPAPAQTPGIVRFVILGRDISAAIQARHMQEAIQHLLAKVFSSVDAAVAIVNAAGRIVMTNPGIDRLLGYKPNGLVGRSTLDLVATNSRISVAATVKQQMQDGGAATYSAPVLREDGSELVVQITSVVTATADMKKFRIVTLQPGTIGTSIRSETVGRFKLVGLDEVRKALGDRWLAAAERVMTTAEVIIKRNCGLQDSFSRVDDTNFLMCFGTLTKEEASFRAAMISREIRTRLIGQGEDPVHAHVRSIVAAVRFTNQGESGTSLNAVLSDGLDKQLERLEREARQTLSDALGTATCDLEPAFGRNLAQPVATQVFIPSKLERKLVGALAALPQEEAKAFDLDGLLIGLAARYAATSMAEGDTTPVLVKISFDIFNTRAATERFFTMYAKIDRRLTARLVLLLSSLPAGLPRARLQDCVNRLRPFCGGVGFQIAEMAELPEIDLSTSFNPIVVLSAAACAVSAPAKLKEWFSLLQLRRAKVLVREIALEKGAAAFLSLGADMVSMTRPIA